MNITVPKRILSYFLFLTVFLSCAIFLSPVYPANADVQQGVTEGEFAMMLVRVMGLEERLPANSMIQDYVSILKGLEVNPKKGWDIYKPLTRKKMAEILVIAMGFKDEVAPMQAQCDRYADEITAAWKKIYEEKNAWPALQELLGAAAMLEEGKAKVIRSTGDVVIERSGQRLSAAKGTLLGPLDKIFTGPDSSIELTFDSVLDNVIRIGQNSEAVLEQTIITKEVRVRLDKGSIMLKLEKLAPGSNFKVRTPAAVAAVRGTGFNINAAASDTTIELFENKIYIERITGQGKEKPQEELFEEGLKLYVTAAEPAIRREALSDDDLSKWGNWKKEVEALKSAAGLTKGSFPDGSPRCPSGSPYEDKENGHVIDRHQHYMDFLDQKGILIDGNPDGTLSPEQVAQILKSSPFDTESARPYLTSATPIMPEEIKTVVQDAASGGRLYAVVYENGTSITRKAWWDVNWKANEPIHIAVSYANDASLPETKSIMIYVNGNPTGISAMGKWGDVKSDKFIWVGAQSLTGDNPAGAVMEDLAIFDYPKTDFTSEIKELPQDRELSQIKGLKLWSSLSDKENITNPSVGKGEISGANYVQKFEPGKLGKGVLIDKDGEAVLFPAQENMDLKRGTIEFWVTPNFATSDKEHVFFSNVDWTAPGGASGIYIYYRKEGKRE